MQHNLGRVVGGVGLVSLAPVIANGIGKNGTGLVEFGGGDTTTDIWITLQSVLGILIPEVECAVATGCTKRSMLRVERDVVDSIDICGLILGLVPMAFE